MKYSFIFEFWMFFIYLMIIIFKNKIHDGLMVAKSMTFVNKENGRRGQGVTSKFWSITSTLSDQPSDNERGES